mmetsp:Transcript_33706/g.34336  ORF Transcript_33706/g.34336 Transcript_33706/m.34336 type:complete len:80 (+) Transcript_33706:441-680(+)
MIQIIQAKRKNQLHYQHLPHMASYGLMMIMMLGKKRIIIMTAGWKFNFYKGKKGLRNFISHRNSKKLLIIKDAINSNPK